MGDAILILNAGSSSLKFSVLASGEFDRPLLRGQIAGLSSSPRFSAVGADGKVVGEQAWGSGHGLTHEQAVEFLFTWAVKEGMAGTRLMAAGHRVVHGGTKFIHPALVTAEVLRAIDELVPLAPLHQPHNAAAIRAVAAISPELPQVACFDTAFHCTQPAVASTFAIPRKYTQAGVRRYGFHGLSYEYIAGVLPGLDARAAAGRTIVAHLGQGASLCALQGGRSVATTMGLTALDGLIMGTRCGAIDPGVLLYLHQHTGLSVEEIQCVLYEESGLLGVSGVSGDMRTLIESQDPRASEAVELFVYRAAREIGSLAAALGGVDALVFTGGIGENAPSVRAAICGLSRWLGVEFDEHANARGEPRVSRSDSRVSVWVVPTNEELMIAKHTMNVLAEVHLQHARDDAAQPWNVGGNRHAEC
ncbi:MAG: acetate/propionate family kinase [Phycisphaerales bacterium]